jgi:hypothetical protein
MICFIYKPNVTVYASIARDLTQSGASQSGCAVNECRSVYSRLLLLSTPSPTQASLLLKYAEKEGAENVRSDYFRVFRELIEVFAKQDFSQMVRTPPFRSATSSR